MQKPDTQLLIPFLRQGSKHLDSNLENIHPFVEVAAALIDFDPDLVVGQLPQALSRDVTRGGFDWLDRRELLTCDT